MNKNQIKNMRAMFKYESDLMGKKVEDQLDKIGVDGLVALISSFTALNKDDAQTSIEAILSHGDSPNLRQLLYNILVLQATTYLSLKYS